MCFAACDFLDWRICFSHASRWFSTLLPLTDLNVFYSFFLCLASRNKISLKKKQSYFYFYVLAYNLRSHFMVSFSWLRLACITNTTKFFFHTDFFISSATQNFRESEQCVQIRCHTDIFQYHFKSSSFVREITYV